MTLQIPDRLFSCLGVKVDAIIANIVFIDKLCCLSLAFITPVMFSGISSTEIKCFCLPYSNGADRIAASGSSCLTIAKHFRNHFFGSVLFPRTGFKLKWNGTYYYSYHPTFALFSLSSVVCLSSSGSGTSLLGTSMEYDLYSCQGVPVSCVSTYPTYVSCFYRYFVHCPLLH